VAETAAARAPWTGRSAWAGILPAGSGLEAPGVTVRPRDGLGLATVIAGRGAMPELAVRLRELHGVALPDRPVVARGPALDFVWAGPDQWLAVSKADPRVAARLAADCGPLAAVSDQSDGRAVLRIGGPRARAALAKGCPLDLHPRAFRPGDAALTAIGHVGVQLWQVDEGPAYDVAVFRSMARSFWTWLSSAAAEFGVDAGESA
jgi:heterotetrameric sarcosine oxidase gamma subunit